MKTFTEDEVHELARARRMSPKDFLAYTVAPPPEQEGKSQEDPDDLSTVVKAIENAAKQTGAGMATVAKALMTVCNDIGKLSSAKPEKADPPKITVHIPARPSTWTAVVSERDANGRIKTVKFEGAK